MDITIEEQEKWLEENKEEVIEQYRKGIESDILNKYSSMNVEELRNHVDIIMSITTLDDIVEEKKMIGKFANCKETINDIDLHEILESIRYNDYESLVHLFIKNGEIIEISIKKGLASRTNTSTQTEIEMIEKAKLLNCDLYTVHNHPFGLRALPSSRDFESWNKLNKIAKEYGVNYIDGGVVSKLDYYSYRQKEKK